MSAMNFPNALDEYLLEQLTTMEQARAIVATVEKVIIHINIEDFSPGDITELSLSLCAAEDIFSRVAEAIDPMSVRRLLEAAAKEEQS